MLNFLKEFEKKVSPTLNGTRRIQIIDKLLSGNQERKKEAYSVLRKLLLKMPQISASDLDIGGPRTNNLAWFRIYGKKLPYKKGLKISNEEATALLLSVLDMNQKKALIDNRNLDFALHVKDDSDNLMRYRANMFFERGYLCASIRHIQQSLRDLEDLGIPEPIVNRLNLSHEKTGLILITGITGSGKSTTLDTIIDLNNKNNEGHIIIIGNPIEYVHTSNKSIVSHREIGEDVLTFKNGTLEALRQDPDIIVVGEMRSAATISTVLEVTDSGHKVFSTLHTSSSVESIHRIIAEFAPSEQERIRFRLADTLKVVISQKLVPNVNGRLSLAKEILSVDPSVQAAIRNDNITEIFQMITEGKQRGMYTLHQDLLRLVQKGVITRETALDHANNRKVMKQLLKYT
ncbi:MAG: ATPase, T2SS/T4P/T4SS family [Candidatus Cloacimonadota bacterium]|nr:ATPase, T2SS/T4P/T4SS family [Candidatus Cloacimonadota bacterium]